MKLLEILTMIIVDNNIIPSGEEPALARVQVWMDTFAPTLFVEESDARSLTMYGRFLLSRLIEARTHFPDIILPESDEEVALGMAYSEVFGQHREAYLDHEGQELSFRTQLKILSACNEIVRRYVAWIRRN